MRKLYVISVFLLMLGSLAPASAQVLDRRDVRRGNRDFRKEDWKNAEIDYRKSRTPPRSRPTTTLPIPFTVRSSTMRPPRAWRRSGRQRP